MKCKQCNELQKSERCPKCTSKLLLELEKQKLIDKTFNDKKVAKMWLEYEN